MNNRRMMAHDGELQMIMGLNRRVENVKKLNGVLSHITEMEKKLGDAVIDNDEGTGQTYAMGNWDVAYLRNILVKGEYRDFKRWYNEQWPDADENAWTNELPPLPDYQDNDYRDGR